MSRPSLPSAAQVLRSYSVRGRDSAHKETASRLHRFGLAGQADRTLADAVGRQVGAALARATGKLAALADEGVYELVDLAEIHWDMAQLGERDPEPLGVRIQDPLEHGARATWRPEPGTQTYNGRWSGTSP